MNTSIAPRGMNRRHFMEHLIGASALAWPAVSFAAALRKGAADLKKNQRAAILLWMNGGPSTIDIWDLKPGSDRRTLSAHCHLGRRADLRASAAAGEANAPPIHYPLDEHARSRPHARPLSHAHGVRARSIDRTPRLWVGGQPHAGRADPATRIGHSAVCRGRRRQCRAWFPGHGKRPVRGQFRRQRAQSEGRR